MMKLHFCFYLKGVISACVLVRCLSLCGVAALLLLHVLWGSPLMALLSAFLTLEVQMPKENSVWPLWTLSDGKLSGPPPWLSSASRVLPMDKQSPGPQTL